MVEQVELIDSLELLGDGSGFHDELCAMIERVQLFSDFTRGEVETLARYARAYKAEPGKTIFREGEKGAFMCLLVEGKVDIYKQASGHERKKISTVRPGKTMGEMSLIDDLPYSATGIAAEPVTVVMITRIGLDTITKDHPALGNKVLWKVAKLISLRLRQTTGTLLDHL